jgi:hypothetical protein
LVGQKSIDVTVTNPPKAGRVKHSSAGSAKTFNARMPLSLNNQKIGQIPETYEEPFFAPFTWLCPRFGRIH